MAKVEVELVRSPIGSNKKHQVVVKTLGLRKMRAKNLLPDTPATWGQINKVSHLLSVRKVEDSNG